MLKTIEIISFSQLLQTDLVKVTHY